MMADVAVLWPFVSGSHLFVASPEEYMIWIFLEVDSRKHVRMQCSWFDSGYILGVSLRVLLKEFLAFLRDGEPGSRGRFSFRLEI